MAPTSEPIDISCLWKTLYNDGDVTELRVMYAEKFRTCSGYFNNPNDIAKSAKAHDGQANVYFTLNPVNPALLARSVNRAKTGAKNTTADADIPHLRWLLIDYRLETPLWYFCVRI